MSGIDLRYWRGTEMDIERIYVRLDGEEQGYWQRSAFDGIGWKGESGRSPAMLDRVIGEQRLGQHESWRHASQEGDSDPIWFALMFAAGVR